MGVRTKPLLVTVHNHTLKSMRDLMAAIFGYRGFHRCLNPYKPVARRISWFAQDNVIRLAIIHYYKCLL